MLHLSAAAIAHLHFIQHWKVTCFHFWAGGRGLSLRQYPSVITNITWFLYTLYHVKVCLTYSCSV